MGTTKPHSYTKNISWNHPHVCGDYLIVNYGCSYCSESPPRMWGLRGTQYLDVISFRITPTYVGTTLEFFRGIANVTNHPHVCGDYQLSWLHCIIALESPPRMWGLLNNAFFLPDDFRITPTYVGTTDIENILLLSE